MKYQKIKKVTIDAVQIQKETINEAIIFVGSDPLTSEEAELFADVFKNTGLYVQTVEGTKNAAFGDYIVKTEEGYNVVSGPLFESMYEKVLE